MNTSNMNMNTMERFMLHNEAQAKEIYTDLRASYSHMTPSSKSQSKSMRAEIDIFAGVYNHDRALFEKGMKKWKREVMKEFAAMDDGCTIRIQKLDMSNESFTGESTRSGGEPIVKYNGNMGVLTGEDAIFSLGDVIRTKRVQFEKLQEVLNNVNWWY